MMFWSMIEMGIAVVAGCLPTIWPLISNISLDDMMRTVRSVLSLDSLRSAASGSQSRSKSTGRSGSKSDRPSTDADLELYTPVTESIHGREQK